MPTISRTSTGCYAPKYMMIGNTGVGKTEMLEDSPRWWDYLW